MDSLRNLAGNPRAALMFFVPGAEETLRVFGTTSWSPADALGIDLTEFGRAPMSVVVLAVQRAYFQCSQGRHALGAVGPGAAGGPVGVPAVRARCCKDHCRDDADPRRGDAARADLALRAVSPNVGGLPAYVPAWPSTSR